MVAYLPDGTRLLAGYVPLISLSVIGLIVYGALAIVGFLHLWRMGRKFMITLLIGLTAMAIGFILRIVLAGSPGSLGIYIITTLLLLLSPCAFLAADYIILSRLSRHLGDDTVGQDCLLIRPSLLVKLFCWSDGVTFFLQMSGGGLSASANLANIGKYVTLVGLGIQLVSFSLFTVTLVLFGIRVKQRFPSIWFQSSSSSSHRQSSSLFAFWRTDPRSDWKTLYYTLLITTLGIMIRCVFRFVEYTQGYSGYLASHEAFFYLLDALPLAIAMGLFMFVWPPRFLPLDSRSDSGSLEDGRDGAPYSAALTSSPRKEEYSLEARK